MGVKRSSKIARRPRSMEKGAKKPKTDLENPLSIFKQGVGKPSLKDGYLRSQRDAWISLLEPLWHELGWAFEAASKLEDIQRAFRVIESRTHSHSVSPFVRKTIELAEKTQIESTRKSYEEAVKRLDKANKEYQDSVRLNEDIKRLAFNVSEEFRKQIEEDLKQRRKRIRSLKIERSRTRARMQKYKRLREKYLKSKDTPGRDYSPYLERKLGRIERDISADERVCVDLGKHLSGITPKNRQLALEEQRNCQEKLTISALVFREATAKCDDFQTKLLNQEAYYFRAELLRFINSGDYAIEPRSIANALAGLPHLTCRRSAERCSRLTSSIAVALNYKLFQFIQSRWDRRLNRGGLSLVDWFKREVKHLPQKTRTESKRQENPLRMRLAKDWYFLKKAVEEVQALKSGSVPKPYFIAQRFLLESQNPATPTDRILAERETLTE